MATYYTNPNNQRDGAPMFYGRETVPGSYPEASVIPGNMTMYMNSGSFSDPLAGNSQQQHNNSEVPSMEHDYNAWRDGRNEMLLLQPGMLDGHQNLQGQGLSLSLSTQVPNGIQFPSFPYRNHNQDFSSFLSPNSGGFAGGNQDSHKGELSPYGMSSAARSIPGSKYLKAAQQLLDEAVNVRKALKQSDTEKNKNGQSEKNEAVPSNPQESTSSTPSELSQAERQDLQNKMTKLLSMLDEVDRRYKQYYHQMQIVVSSFDAVAGCGATKSYTALALQTISRHFRCLRDAITGQIRAARKSLGEQDTVGNGKGVGISRLRFVDQHLKQQRALQQLGMMQQHAWRPQRGLPESSVSILRAWLFEHFLHPYPKDSDKIMLARQTGLTRSQVSNWFINARVRLWKPMVEEMYKEEAGDAEMESNSSSENAGKGTRGDTRTSEDRGDDIPQSLSSTAIERCSAGQYMESKSDHVPEIEMAGSTGVDGEAEYDLLFPNNMVQSNGGSERFMGAAYQMPEMSLTLGLQHCDGSDLSPMSGGTHHHHSFVPVRGDEIYSAVGSSVGHEAADFECIDAGNRQHRFNSSQLLHDFVA